MVNNHISSNSVTMEIPCWEDILLYPTLHSIFSFWVGSNWIWITRPVDTDLGRWTLVLMLMLIFCLAVWEKFFHTKYSGIGVFLIAQCRLIVGDQLGGSDWIPGGPTLPRQKYQGSVKTMFYILHISITCYDRWFFSEGHENYSDSNRIRTHNHLVCKLDYL